MAGAGVCRGHRGDLDRTRVKGACAEEGRGCTGAGMVSQVRANQEMVLKKDPDEVTLIWVGLSRDGPRKESQEGAGWEPEGPRVDMRPAVFGNSNCSHAMKHTIMLLGRRC